MDQQQKKCSKCHKNTWHGKPQEAYVDNLRRQPDTRKRETRTTYTRGYTGETSQGQVDKKMQNNERKGGSQSLKHLEESKCKKSEEQDKTKHQHDKSDFNQQYRRKKKRK